MPWSWSARAEPALDHETVRGIILELMEIGDNTRAILRILREEDGGEEERWDES